jgi:hypothetical protein
MFIALVFVSGSCKRSGTEPEEPGRNLVTFIGRAFLAGQPAPVNRLHLPLHYDIEIISFLPGDTTSYDTTYTDSSGVYTSTRQRKDGRYKIISRYPYYSKDTVQVEVRDGQVVGEIPRLFSQRLERIQIFADSSVYHSLRSSMFFTQYITNFSALDTIGAPRSLIRLLVPKNNPSIIFSTPRAPNIDYLIPLQPLEVKIYYNGGVLNNFYDRVNNASPTTGSYFLYAVGEPWSFIGAWYPHYRNSIHWWFKVAEPSEIQVDFKL